MKKWVMIAALLASVGGPVAAKIGETGAPQLKCDAGPVVTVRVGAERKITVPNNAGNGYSWIVTNIVNAEQVGPVKITSKPPKRPGGPTSWTFTFRFPRLALASVTLGKMSPGKPSHEAECRKYTFQVI